MHGLSMQARSTKTNRRRFTYTQNDQRRWLTIGALLIASAATLGYIGGRYSEKHRKNGVFTQLLHKKDNNNNNNNNDNNNNKRTASDDAEDGYNRIDISPINYERDYRILIYGDSTTWGYDPDKQKRLRSDERYPCILEKQLNEDNLNRYYVEIISEGLNGRTINHRDLEGNKKNERRSLSMNGIEQLLPILYSHKPIDIIIIMLGINDCKSKFNPSSNKIANNMNKLIEQCMNAEIWPIDENTVNHGPRIILISPPSIRELTEMNQDWGWNKSSINVSQSLYSQYDKICNKYDKDLIHFINANQYIQTGSDSVHIDGINNRKLANILTTKIKKIIENLQIKARKMSVPSFTTSSRKHHREQSNHLKSSLRPHHNQQEQDDIDDDIDDDEESLSELEHERNGDHVIIENKNKNNNDNFHDNQQCDSNHKSKST